MVSKPEYRNSKRDQGLEIYYNGVGIIREQSSEEMEEYFQEHLKQKPSKRYSRRAISLQIQQYFNLRYKALGCLPYGGWPNCDRLVFI